VLRETAAMYLVPAFHGPLAALHDVAAELRRRSVELLPGLESLEDLPLLTDQRAPAPARPPTPAASPLLTATARIGHARTRRLPTHTHTHAHTPVQGPFFRDYPVPER